MATHPMTTRRNAPNRIARGSVHLWVALLLALLLLVSWLMGYGPGGSKCAPAAQANLGGAAAVGSATPPAGPAVAAASAATATSEPAAAPASTPPAPASAEAMVAAFPVAAANVAAPVAAPSATAAAPAQTGSAATVQSAAPTSPASPAVATTTSPTPAPVPSPAPAAVASAVPVAKVYFAVEKATVPKNAGRVLARAVNYLKANPRATALVSGFHDPSGNLANNQNLALRRAQAVASSMQKMGIAKQRIVLQKPEQTVGSGNAAEARRVEVGVAKP